MEGTQVIGATTATYTKLKRISESLRAEYLIKEFHYIDDLVVYNSEFI